MFSSYSSVRPWTNAWPDVWQFLSKICYNYPGITSRKWHYTCWLGSSAFSDGTGMPWCWKGKYLIDGWVRSCALYGLFVIWSILFMLCLLFCMRWCHNELGQHIIFLTKATQINQLESELGFLVLICNLLEALLPHSWEWMGNQTHHLIFFLYFLRTSIPCNE